MSPELLLWGIYTGETVNAQSLAASKHIHSVKANDDNQALENNCSFYAI